MRQPCPFVRRREGVRQHRVGVEKLLADCRANAGDGGVAGAVHQLHERALCLRHREKVCTSLLWFLLLLEDVFLLRLSLFFLLLLNALLLRTARGVRSNRVIVVQPCDAVTVDLSFLLLHVMILNYLQQVTVQIWTQIFDRLEQSLCILSVLTLHRPLPLHKIGPTGDCYRPGPLVDAKILEAHGFEPLSTTSAISDSMCGPPNKGKPACLSTSSASVSGRLPSYATPMASMCRYALKLNARKTTNLLLIKLTSEPVSEVNSTVNAANVNVNEITKTIDPTST